MSDMDKIEAKFSKKASGYVAEYEPLNIQFNISHLHTAKWGAITAEMLIKDTKSNSGNVIKWQTVDLLGNRTPLINSLLRTNPKIPWSELVDDVCHRSLTDYKSGEPAVLLDTSREIKPPEFLVYPLLLKNKPNIFFGEAKSCKSEIAKMLSIACILPYTDNKLQWIVPEEPTQTLYLDWEDDEDTFLYQYKQLSMGIGIDGMQLIHYRRCYHSLSDDIEQIQEWVYKTKAKLVIVDSILGAVGGRSSKDTETAAEFYNSLRQLGNITTLLIGHTSKAEARPGQKKTVIGSMNFEARARSVWEVKMADESSTSVKQIGMFNTAFNQKQMRPVSYKVNFHDDNDDYLTMGTTIELASVDGAASLEDRLPLYKKIHKVIAGTETTRGLGWATTKEIFECLGGETTMATVNTTLRRYTRIFKKIDDKWGLFTMDEPNGIKQGELNE